MFAIVRLVVRVLRSALFLFVFLFLIQRSTYPLGLNWNAVSAIVGGDQFDYVAWEINAIAAKTAQVLWGEHPYLDEISRSQMVLDYMDDMRQVQALEGQIQGLYVDPTVSDPDVASAQLRVERDAIRHDLGRRQTLIESILEGQVAAILVDEGFGMLGQLLPPISMRFTQMPNLLVVSPRDRIERSVELTIDPMPLETIIIIENRIELERDMAPLVLPLGGLALYPAMIQETSDLPWAVETFAHEWIHHYFFFYPLGQNYFTTANFGREALIINETTADVFGKAIKEKVLAQYYPEFITERSNVQLVSYMEQQPEFDYGHAMHITRVTVDKYMNDIDTINAKSEMLHDSGYDEWAVRFETRAEAYVDQVETYMEERRALFFENGYRIRKLNQAYFAFYGGYQAGDRPGVGGRDPIGPAVQAIFEVSPSLHAFVVTMRDITTREGLVAVAEQLNPSANLE